MFFLFAVLNILAFIHYFSLIICSNLSLQNNFWTQANSNNCKKNSDYASISDLIENIHFQEKEHSQQLGSNLCYNSNFGEDNGDLQALLFQQKIQQVNNNTLSL